MSREFSLALAEEQIRVLRKSIAQLKEENAALKIDEDYYAGLGIPKNATNIRVRVLTSDEKDKYIAQLKAENAALKRKVKILMDAIAPKVYKALLTAEEQE